MTEKTCRTFLVSDVPSEKDEFGAHQKLADAVSSLILSENDGGKTIGIEGDWGSGKSTVINLISLKLSQDDHNLIFLFDAWAHRDDPLRRTFLESLISQAENKKWVDPGVWGKRRAILGQQLRIERKVINSNLKVWARWFVVSALFVPVGIALLSSGLNATTSVDNLTASKVVLGLFLTLSPVVILLSVFVNNWFKQQIKESENEQEDPWSFLVQNSITDTSSQTFQTPNPTSIEFSKAFFDFIDTALEEKERKVIIVLDNLDRVEADDALNLLSTLQTFLQHNNHSLPWLNRLWIIIPYDRAGLEKLWKTNQNRNESSQVGNLQDRVFESEVAASFIDKRFQIRFEIPPIVLSDWSLFLKRLLKFALPDHAEEEFHSTYRVYAIFRPNSDNSPTPRELKLFVNQIGTIHRQWGDAFPLSHIAYYVLAKRRGENVIQKLLTGDYRQPQFEAFLGTEIIDSLAAFTFNVEVPLARQLLLAGPVESALRDGNEARLLGLVDSPGFRQVLEGIHFSEWVDQQANQLINAVLILAKNMETIAPDAGTKWGITREFKQALLNSRTWFPVTSHLAGGLATIFELVNADNRLVRSTFHVISNTKIDTSDNNSTKSIEIIHSWIDGLILLLDAVQKTKNLNDVFTDKILIPCSANMYIEGCSYLSTVDPGAKYWHMFRPTVSAEEIVTELIKSTSDTTGIAGCHSKAIKVIKRHELNVTWDRLLTDVKNKLQSTNNNSPEFIKYSLQILWELKEATEFKSILSSSAKQGFILHHLYIVKKDTLAAAYCIFSHLFIFPDGRIVNRQGESDNGYSYITQIFNSPDNYVQLTEQFTELLNEYFEYDLPFRMLAAEGSKQWVAQILKKCSNRDNSQRYFTVNNMLQHWPFIEKSLGREGFDLLSEKMINETDVIQQIVSTEFSVNQAGLYASLTRRGAIENETFVNWCSENIKKISQKELQEHINTNDAVAELIVDLVDKNIEIDLGTDYQEIIFNHAVALIKGEIHVNYLKDHWDRLLKPLSLYSRDTLRDRLVEIVLQRNGDFSQEFFAIYGDELIEVKGLERNRLLVLNVFTPMIKNRNLAGLMWIVKLLEGNPLLLHNYSPKRHVEDMGDWLEQALINDTNNEVHVYLQKISKFIKKEDEPSNLVDKSNE